MSAVVDVLRAARDLVERGWCQKDEAINESGAPVHPGDDGARAWCAVGALYQGHRGSAKWAEWKAARDALLTDGIGMTACLAASPNDLIACWNDHPRRTQAEVLAAFDRAIEAAESTK